MLPLRHWSSDPTGEEPVLVRSDQYPRVALLVVLGSEVRHRLMARYCR